MGTGSPGRSLTSRRIVITGAARGLGRSLALAVADAGGSVVLLGRDTAALDSVAATIFSRTQQRAEVVRCDLAQPESIRAACEVILGANPAVDVLINNGAPWLEGRLADLSEADIVATVAAGVTGTILITRGLLPGLARSGAADIVTIVSTAGLPGGEFDSASTAFHAAKHGQTGFCDRLRAEVKSQAIRVAAIFPADFEHVDPGSDNARAPTAGGKLTSSEVVAAVMFALTAPRNCAIRAILLEGTGAGVKPQS
jgi:NAD(P)-dependent dehydrogenase (short-subunit alcohol dehydrogenase family)